jgi:hypothetical protein
MCTIDDSDRNYLKLSRLAVRVRVAGTRAPGHGARPCHASDPKSRILVAPGRGFHRSGP